MNNGDNKFYNIVFRWRNDSKKKKQKPKNFENERK